MAEENPTNTPVVPPPVTTVQTQTTTETLDSNGKTLEGNGNLHAIFDKIESGKPAKEAVSEVMEKKTPKVPDDKKEEKVVEKSDKKEEAPGSLEDSLDKKEKREDKKEEKVDDKTQKTEDEVPEEELQVLPHDKPKTAKRIAAILAKASKASEEVALTKKEIAARDEKLKTLEEQLSKVKTVDPKTEEAVQKQLEELTMFRRRYDLEKDPSVKSKYDDRITANETQIEALVPSVLKKHGAGEGLINLIKEEGGWNKFSQSTRKITLAGGEIVSAAELADQIISQIPFSDRKMIDAISMEQVQLKREKDRFIEEETKVANEFFKKKDEETAKNREASQQQIKTAQEFITKWHADVIDKNEFFKEKPVPANATADQKKAIEEDNAASRQLNEVLKKNLGVKDIESMVGIVLDSVKYHAEHREVTRLQARLQKAEADIKAKQDELDRFKNSGRTTTKAGSLVGGGSGNSTAPVEKKPKSLEEALDMALADKEQ